MSIAPWSFSKIKSFEQCPKKFYHLKVAKDYKEPETEAMLYGTAVHLAAEEYVRDGKPLPPEYMYIKAPIDALCAKQGEKICELEMGLTADLEPCGFFDDDCWYRGIADLVIVDRENKLAWVIDYKTGKNAAYADTKQLDLLAGATFTHFPEVETVKSALLYVVSNDFIRKKHTADLRKSYLSVFDEELDRLEVALEEDVWNAVESGLCGFCPVTSCEHNRR